jgi:hypothetical protein
MIGILRLIAKPEIDLISEPVIEFRITALYKLGIMDPNLAVAVKFAINFDLNGTPFAS